MKFSFDINSRGKLREVMLMGVTGCIGPTGVIGRMRKTKLTLKHLSMNINTFPRSSFRRDK